MKKHTRARSVVGRNVPHPKRHAGAAGSWPAARKQGAEDEARRARMGEGRGARIARKDLFEPRRPAILYLYEDLNDLEIPAPVFGMYPEAFIPKILPWLRCERRRLVHVCSGALPRGEGIRVDLREEARPDVRADGLALPFRAGSVDGVLIDPPYTEHYARDLYGVKYPRPAHLLREAARVVRPCGRIGFVHYITPNPPDGCRFVKAFGLSVGFGFPMRACTIYEREQEGLFR